MIDYYPKTNELVQLDRIPDKVIFMKVNPNAHWRDSARSIKFFIWDGKSAFPMLLFLLHISLWTFIVAVVGMMFFTVLNRFGFTPTVFLRWMRSAIAGPRKLATPWWIR